MVILPRAIIEGVRRKRLGKLLLIATGSPPISPSCHTIFQSEQILGNAASGYEQNLQGPAVSAERHRSISPLFRMVVKSLRQIEGSEEQFRHDGPTAALAVDNHRHAV